MNRPTREQLYMKMAFDWADRSTCSLPNRRCGAVITSGDMRQVLSIGYNGPGKGLSNTYCNDWREEHSDNESESLSRCPCLHAEDNAIAFVNGSIPDKSIFITMSPCLICAQRIINANIRRVYFQQVYRDIEPVYILNLADVSTILMMPDDYPTRVTYHTLKETSSYWTSKQTD